MCELGVGCPEYFIQLIVHRICGQVGKRTDSVSGILPKVFFESLVHELLMIAPICNTVCWQHGKAIDQTLDSKSRPLSL